MKIGFVWTGFTSYMADCWRELAGRPGVELRVWIEEQRKSNLGFDPQVLMKGVRFGWDYSDQITDIEQRQVSSEIAAFGPDVLFICGWSKQLPPYLASCAELRDVVKVLDFDMPWEWTLRKFAARFVLGPRLRPFVAAFVPGSSTARYARWLGFRRVYAGRNCVDLARFCPPEGVAARSGFVFAGRLVTDKNIRLLAEAYRRYRAEGGTWGLDVYGMGDEAHGLEGLDGAKVHGFAQPDELPRIYGRAGALLLPSKWEPWGQVLVEAMACGCPVVCSDVCGAVDVVRAAQGGVVVRQGSVAGLVRAMHAMERRKDAWPIDRKALEEYSCAKWADRVTRIATELKRKD